MGFLFGMPLYISKCSLECNSKTSAKTYDQQFAQKLQSEQRPCENSSPGLLKALALLSLVKGGWERYENSILKNMAVKRRGINSSHCMGPGERDGVTGRD